MLCGLNPQGGCPSPGKPLVNKSFVGIAGKDPGGSCHRRVLIITSHHYSYVRGLSRKIPSFKVTGKQTTGRMQQAFLLRNFKKLKFELNRQGAVPHSRNSEGSVFAVFTENDELCYGGCATEQRLNKPSRSQMETQWPLRVGEWDEVWPMTSDDTSRMPRLSKVTGCWKTIFQPVSGIRVSSLRSGVKAVQVDNSEVFDISDRFGPTQTATRHPWCCLQGSTAPSPNLCQSSQWWYSHRWPSAVRRAYTGDVVLSEALAFRAFDLKWRPLSNQFASPRDLGDLFNPWATTAKEGDAALAWYWPPGIVGCDDRSGRMDTPKYYNGELLDCTSSDNACRSTVC
ncbi:hypothetical protein EDD16DRAFT_1516271 [Pisolithus croceorrhizus]|nr:hypothetical protein EDD16DRAFT_1516271 [Pisolithus croceorrhizus]